MKKKVLIFGAGSIGNHMANACLKLGCQVYITDKSLKALNFMKSNLFLKRYGYWDNQNINQIRYKDIKNLKSIFFDLIIIGTPPNSHYFLAELCNKTFKFKNMLIEKPICSFKEDQNKFLKFYKFKDKRIFCGYNHSLSPGIKKILDISKKYKRELKFIEVKWKEGWTGILNAHYWLKDEFSSYLGDIKKGGGALQEHSHGLHLSILFLETLLSKNYKIVDFKSFFKKKREKKYDFYNNINFESMNKNLLLEIDLLEPNSLKQVTITFDKMTLRWICNYKKNLDIVKLYKNNKYKSYEFKKTRESEFVNEIKHIFSIKNLIEYQKSPINIFMGIKTISAIKKVFKNLN